MTDGRMPGGLSSFGFIVVFPGPIVFGLLVAPLLFDKQERAAANRAA